MKVSIALIFLGVVGVAMAWDWRQLGCPEEYDPKNQIDLPHPSDCIKFLSCIEHGVIERECGIGTQFNPESRECDHPENAKCQGANANVEDPRLALAHQYYVEHAEQQN